jgi:hypothetical protein
MLKGFPRPRSKRKGRPSSFCRPSGAGTALDPRAEDQNRNIPNRNSNATVIKPEIRSEPRHPSRFEKKKNMRCPL